MAQPVPQVQVGAAPVPDQAAPPPRLFSSTRGGEKLSADGFLYLKKRVSADTTVWRCELYKKTCKGACSTKLTADGTVYVVNSTEHNHFATPVRRDTQLLAATLKNAVVAEPTANLKRLCSVALARKSTQKLAELPAASTLARLAEGFRRRDSRNKQNAQLAAADAEPGQADLSTTRVPPELFQPNNEAFLLHDSGPEHGNKLLLVLATTAGVQALLESKFWLSDGTFFTSPQGFTQTYTLFAETQGVVLPHFYAQMNGKSKKDYANLWELLATYLYGSTQPADCDGQRLHSTDFEPAAYLCFCTVSQTHRALLLLPLQTGSVPGCSKSRTSTQVLCRPHLSPAVWLARGSLLFACRQSA
jgi:hypothetical protein